MYRAIVAILYLNLLFATSPTKADDASEFEVYESAGAYYVKSTPDWVPIAGNITFFIPTYDEGDIVKLTNSGNWTSSYVSYSDFVSANAQPSNATINYTDLNSDGVTDIAVTINGEALYLLADGNETWSLNTAPAISGLANISVSEDTAATRTFVVSDSQESPSELSVSVTSSNTTLIANNQINVTRSGSNYTLTATPTANKSGSSTLTITADDGLQTTTQTMVVTVSAVNDTPTITNIANQTINEDGTVTVGFTVSDVETSAGSLSLTKQSSNTGLLPTGNIVFGGSGSSRTVTLTPLANKNGTATVTIGVSDGSKSASDGFVLTVSAVNDTPTITNIANQTINEDGTVTVGFTVSDVETSAGSLSLTKQSSNTGLLPTGNIVFGGSGSSRTVTLTPLANKNGTATVTIGVSDGSKSASDSFVLTVNSVNDAPSISNITNKNINENGSLSTSFTVSDIETSASALTVSATSNSPILVDEIAVTGSGSSRTLKITPFKNKSGSASITVTVSDGNKSSLDTFTLTVNPLIDPETPVAPTLESMPTTEDVASTKVATLSGEFRVDESGAATYSLPISLPAGAGGVSPQVALSYSSAAGSGSMGIGWALQASSAISRCRKTYETDSVNASVNLNNEDRFCLDGQRLILVSGVYGAANSEYRTELDSQTRIIANGVSGNGPDHFTVEKVDGSTSYFGNTTASRLQAANSTVMSWLINKTTDNMNNEIVYSYIKGASDTSFGENEILLSTISYSRNIVEFSYNSDTSNPSILEKYSFMEGIKVEQTARLDEVKVSIDDVLVTNYELSYESVTLAAEDENGATPLRLVEIKQCNGGSICKTPISFDWNSNGLPTGASQYDIIDYSSAIGSFFTAMPFDANGDGFSDLLYVSKSGKYHYVYVAYNNTDDSFGSLTLKTSSYISGDDFEIFPIDIDGDSRQELVMTYGAYGISTKWKYYDLDQSTLVDMGQFVTESDSAYKWLDINADALPDLIYYKSNNYISIHTNNAGSLSGAKDALAYIATGSCNGVGKIVIPDDFAAIDYNGDGRSDISAIVEISCYNNRGAVSRKYFWSPFEIEYDELNDKYQFNALLDESEYILSDTADNYILRNGDVNGDGLADLVTYSKTTEKWELYVSDGNQLLLFNENVITYSNGSAIPKDDIKNIALIDVNEDGLADLVYQNTSNGYWYYHKSNGHAFSERIYLYFNTYNESRYISQLASFDGDSDLDYMRVDLSDKNITLYKGTYGPSAMRNTISDIHYGHGLTTNIEYDRLTNPDFYRVRDGAEDLVYGNGSPVFEIIGPMTVVSRVESSAPGYSSGVYSDTNTVAVEYEYEGLRMQSGGRGALGFKKIKTFDPQTNVSSETVYRQDFPYIGMPIATIKYIGSDTNGLADDGTYSLAQNRILSYAQNTYGNMALNSGKTVFPYILSSTEEQYSVDDSGLSTSLISSVSTTNTYSALSDNHANLTNIVVETYDAGTTLVSRVTTANTFNDDNVADWHLGRVSKTVTTHFSPTAYPTERQTISREVAFEYYDSSEDSGKYYGMLKYERIEPNGGTRDKLSTLHCYDAYGNENETITFSGNTDKDCEAASENTANLSDSSSIYKVFRRKKLVFDSQGIYADSSANDKFTLSTVNSRNDMGLVTKSTDINGVESLSAYDSFGQLFASSNSTGSYSETKLRLFGSELSGTPAIAETYSVVQKTITYGSPTVYTYFDKVGREVAVVKQGFSTDTWIHQYTRYDVYGRPVNQSIPVLVNGTGSATINWSSQATTTLYDDFGRVQSSTAPDGTTTEIAYNGLSTTTSATFDSITQGTLTQSKTESRDEAGNLSSVTDALNTITYSYDATGNLTRVIDDDGVEIRTEFDDLGRKIKTIDPDKGTWSYTYNALGELASQTDEKGTITQYYRDTLGRTVLRDVSNGNDTYYVYNGHQLDTECVYNGSTCNTSKASTAFDYDSFGRVEATWFSLDGNPYVQTVTYDEYGRVFQQFDASGSFQGIRNHYNANGYLYKQVEARNSKNANATVYYEILASNAYGSVTKFEQNSGKIETIQTYSQATGMLERIQTTDAAGVTIQNNEYDFDGIGNLRKRIRHTLVNTDSRYKEEFKYDDLNRLTHVNGAEKVQYYNNGNIRKKDGNYYCYNPSRPHAVSGMGSDGCTTQTYVYDDNGNMKSGRGLNLTYTEFDKVSSISSASGITTFAYDNQRKRYKRTTNEDGVVVDTYYVGNVEIVFNDGEFKETRRYINGAISTQYNSGVTNTSYLHKDHLGSIDTITNESGKVVQKLYFDAWGQKTQISKTAWVASVQNAAATTLVNVLDLTPRGFTGHEHIDHANIIHMNGRIYDPTLGRFLQADPFIQFAQNSQSYNRYSYVLNNPLSYTDPSGYLLSGLFKGVRNFVKKYWRSIVSIGLTIWAPWGTGFWASVGTGAIAGGIATGSLRGALAGAFTAGMFHGIGTHFQGLQDSAGVLSSGARVAKVFAHGTAGGISSILNGGKFGHGFASAGITQAFSGAIDKIGGRIGNITSGSYFSAANRAMRIVASAVLGGAASALTGGKFANGAVTGAFSRGFNDEAHYQADRQSFWDYFQKRVMSGQVRDDIFSALGAYAKGGAGLAGVAGGWLIRPFNPTVGAAMMVDGASSYLGAISDLSNLYYGGNRDYDFVGGAFGDAAEFYGFDRSSGAKARAALSLTTMVGAWRTIVPTTVGASSFSGWGTNQLEYTKYVYSIQTSSAATATVDVYNARGAFQELAPNN